MFSPRPNPPQWARDRVDEICGGSRITDDMPMVAFLAMAEYVAAHEGGEPLKFERKEIAA